MKILLGAGSKEKREAYDKKLNRIAEALNISKEDAMYEIFCNIAWLNNDHLFEYVLESLNTQMEVYNGGKEHLEATETLIKELRDTFIKSKNKKVSSKNDSKDKVDNSSNDEDDEEWI